MSSTSWWDASSKASNCSIARPTSASGSHGKESRMNEPATVDAMGEHAADFVGVINGTRDIMVPTINSFTLSQHIPNAQLILYPDAGHGALFQYPELFVAHTKVFLDA